MHWSGLFLLDLYLRAVTPTEGPSPSVSSNNNIKEECKMLGELVQSIFFSRVISF